MAGPPTAALERAFEDGASPPFLPSERFRGPKPGYVFTTKDGTGTGYYRDGHAEDDGVGGDASAVEEDATAVRDAARRPTAEDLLTEAEELAAREGGAARAAADPANARRLVAQLEKAEAANLEARARHAADPSRFLPSELALDEAARAVGALAASPAGVAAATEAGATGALLRLVAHENLDVVATGLSVLADLLEPEESLDGEEEEEEEEEEDGGEESEGGRGGAKAVSSAEAATAATSAALREGLSSALASLTPRLPPAGEAEDDESAPAALRLLGAALEAAPREAAEAFAAERPLVRLLVRWAARRAGPAGLGAGEAAGAAEALAQMASLGGPRARAALRRCNAIDGLLVALAGFRRLSDADVAAEAGAEDAAEDLGQALESLLLDPRGRDEFLAREGPQLAAMSLSGKGPRAMRAALMRVAEASLGGAALPGNAQALAADALVAGGALGGVFGAFMAHPRKKTRKKRRGVDEVADEDDEDEDPDGDSPPALIRTRALPLIERLVAAPPGDDAERPGRVAAKFAEADHEKTDRLVEILLALRRRVERAAEAAAEVEAEGLETAREAAEEAAGEAPEEREELEAALEALRDAAKVRVEDARRRAGLARLRRAALLVARLWALGDRGLCERLLLLLHARDVSISEVRDVLVEAFEEEGVALQALAAEAGESRGGEGDDDEAADVRRALTEARARRRDLATLVGKMGGDVELGPLDAEGEEAGEEKELSTAVEPKEAGRPASAETREPSESRDGSNTGAKRDAVSKRTTAEERANNVERALAASKRGEGHRNEERRGGGHDERRNRDGRGHDERRNRDGRGHDGRGEMRRSERRDDRREGARGEDGGGERRDGRREKDRDGHRHSERREEHRDDCGQDKRRRLDRDDDESLRRGERGGDWRAERRSDRNGESRESDSSRFDRRERNSWAREDAGERSHRFRHEDDRRRSRDGEDAGERSHRLWREDDRGHSRSSREWEDERRGSRSSRDDYDRNRRRSSRREDDERRGRDRSSRSRSPHRTERGSSP